MAIVDQKQQAALDHMFTQTASTSYDTQGFNSVDKLRRRSLSSRREEEGKWSADMSCAEVSRCEVGV